VSSVSSDSSATAEPAASSAGQHSATETDAGLPRVVLAGRPNAGKSTLFNRLLRRRKALVDAAPGVTRDVNEAVATWDGRSVVLVDTGGFEAEGASGLDLAVGARSLAAARAADLVVYLLDGKAGLSAADEAAARALRRARATVLFVVNKIDSPARESGVAEFHRLGADPLLTVSAEHGHGVAHLVDAILARVRVAAPAARDTAIRVSIIGRPNVGKSSLLNRLLGFPRALVDATAGTTRDAIDTPLEVGGTRYLLVDTAGIRRRSRVQERLERSAVDKALHALGRCEVAVLVIDAGEGLTVQDQKLAALAWSEGRGLVVVANKWDLCAERAAAFVAGLRADAPALAAVPILTTSALSGAGIERILPAVKRVAAAHDAALRTPRLNEVLADAVRALQPPVLRGRRARMYYATQVGRRPPTVAVFTSAPACVPPAYRRFLEKRITDAFRLQGTPLRLQFRARR